MDMTCDRCKKTFDGDKVETPEIAAAAYFTCGYYEVGPSAKAWGQFANPGENIVCDACMFADPRYIAVYGQRA